MISGAPLGIPRIGCKFTGNTGRGFAGDACDAFLPGRGVGAGGIIKSGGPGAGQPGTAHAVLGEQQIIDRGDFASIGQGPVGDSTHNRVDLSLGCSIEAW